MLTAFAVLVCVLTTAFQDLEGTPGIVCTDPAGPAATMLLVRTWPYGGVGSWDYPRTCQPWKAPPTLPPTPVQPTCLWDSDRIRCEMPEGYGYEAGHWHIVNGQLYAYDLIVPDTWIYFGAHQVLHIEGITSRPELWIGSEPDDLVRVGRLRGCTYVDQPVDVVGQVRFYQVDP